MEGIKKVYTKYIRDKCTKLNRTDAMDIFISHSDVQLGPEKTRNAYGLSKMTVANEYKETDKFGYQVIDLVEFIEMICRVAFYKFKGSDLETIDLMNKVEFILDDILPLVGMQRVSGDVEVMEVSESDEDY